MALDHVDLSVAPGQIHALLGGNGSGKSTLIKILAGVQGADAGRLTWVGQEADLAEGWTSEHAWAAGFRFVHQDVGLFPEFTVAENLCVGSGWELAGPQIRWRRAHAKARQALEGLGIDVPTGRKVGELSPAQQTMLAIARAVSDLDDERGRPGLLVLDEPSAVLPDHEMHTLMELVRRVARRGHAVLYVSHRLEEVLAIADHVTVLRDGQVVGTLPRAHTDKAALLQLIVGRPAEDVFVPAGHVRPSQAPVLVVDDLSGGGLSAVSLEAHAGEVVWLAGLAGAGASEALQAVFGLRSRHGVVAVDGRRVPAESPVAAVRAGMAYVPADRLRDGVFPAMTILENVSVVAVS
jgi:ribose transport system ATP-binding protein